MQGRRDAQVGIREEGGRESAQTEEEGVEKGG